MIPRRAAAVIVALWACQASAQTKTIHQTQYAIQAEQRIGFEYRQDIDAALQLALEGDLAAAWKKLQPALAYCDAQQRPGMRVLGFADKQEYETYLAEFPSDQPTEWVDVACPSAYYHAGYLHVSAKSFAEAETMLDKAIAIGPYDADPYVEKGFALNQQGKLQEGIETYRKAIVLAERWPKQKLAKARALRGIGWAYVEMGDLDAAQKAYEESLVIEPGNDLAGRELEYIAKKRAQPAKPTQTTQTTQTTQSKP